MSLIKCFSTELPQKSMIVKTWALGKGIFTGKMMA